VEVSYDIVGVMLSYIDTSIGHNHSGESTYGEEEQEGLGKLLRRIIVELAAL
jgi:hypothetical protein